jgi:hypothetical protein
MLWLSLVMILLSVLLFVPKPYQSQSYYSTDMTMTSRHICTGHKLQWAAESHSLEATHFVHAKNYTVVNSN